MNVLFSVQNYVKDMDYFFKSDKSGEEGRTGGLSKGGVNTHFPVSLIDRKGDLASDLKQLPDGSEVTRLSFVEKKNVWCFLI